MKKLQSILALLMVAAMMLSMGVVALADESADAEIPADEAAVIVEEEVAIDGEEEVAEATDSGVEHFPDGINVFNYFEDSNGNKIYKDKAKTELVTDVEDLTCALGITGTVIGWYFYDGPNGENFYTNKAFEIAHGELEFVSTTATCTSAGVETWKCPICGKTFKKDAQMGQHVWSSDVDKSNWGRLIEDFDCTKGGIAEDYCVICGAKGDRIREIQPSPHELVFKIDEAPVCALKGGEVIFEDGYGHFECKNCGAKPAYVSVGAAASGEPGKLSADDYSDEEVEGFVENKIALDLDAYKANGGNKNYDGHDWSDWKVKTAATCTTNGVQIRTCTRCWSNELQEIPATNHNNWKDFVLVQTHVIDCWTGVNVYQCKDCGDLYISKGATANRVKPGEEQTYTLKARDSQKIEGKLKDFDWTTVDTDKFGEEMISHLYANYVKDYILKGEMTKAEYDKLVKEMEKPSGKNAAAIKEAADSWLKDESYAPTCTEDGQIVFKCLKDDEEHGEDTYAIIVVKAPGHDWTDWVKVNEVVKNGVTYVHYVRECKVCDYHEDFDGDFSPVACAENEHDWVALGSSVPATCLTDGVIDEICQKCGERRTITIEAAGAHEWGEWTILREADCSTGEIGYKLRECAKCHEREVEEIAAEHTPVNVAEVPAQIGVAGTTAGVKCSVCGEWISGGKVIPALTANSYTPDTSAVSNKAGKVTFAADGTADPGIVYARIAWYYTLSDGSTFAYATVKEVTKDADGNLVADVRGAFAPAGATLDKVLVVLTTDADADMSGSYADAALKTPNGSIVSAAL